MFRAWHKLHQIFYGMENEEPKYVTWQISLVIIAISVQCHPELISKLIKEIQVQENLITISKSTVKW